MRDTLRLRLFLLSLALAVPMVVLIGVGIRKKFLDDRADALQRLHTQRTTAEQTLNNYLSRVHFTLRELEQVVGFRDLSSPRAHEQAAEFLRLHPEFINVAVMDRGGTLRFSSAFPLANPPQNYRGMANVDEVLQARDFVVTGAAKGVTTGRWGCVAAHPLALQPELLLAAPIDLARLSQQLFFAPDTSALIVTVLDARNTVVLSSYSASTRIGQLRPMGDVVRHTLAAGASVGEFLSEDGTRRTFDAARCRIADWTVVASVPTDEIYADAWRNLRLALIAVVAVLLAVAVLIHFYAHTLIRPVAALAEVARAHAAGDNQRLAPVAGPVEIADTARAFNEMAAARQRAQAGLVESELRYRTVVDQSGQLVYDLDIPSGRIEWFGHRAIAEITGYTAEEFACVDGRGWEERIHPDDRARVLAVFQHCLTTLAPFLAEYRFRRRDGSFRTIEDFGVVLADPSGQPVRLLGRMSDITARQQTENALRESEQRYRLVIEQTGQLIYDLDIEAKRLRWFGIAAAEQILGCTPEDFSRRGLEGWRERLHPDDHDTAVARLERSLRTGDPCQAEYRLRHSDGSYHLVDERGAVLRRADGTVYRMVGRMTDITERRRVELERQQLDKKLLETQKLESLGVLAGGIAHDFNNLLTGVLGNAGLARLDLPAGSAALKQIAQIEHAAQRAADLCKQMLAYSGKGRFVVQRLNLNELVQESLSLLAVSISKKAALRFESEPDLPAVSADATQLRQVVMNLVINASEALEGAAGEITVTTGTVTVDAAYLATLQFAGELRAGPAVFLAVRDTGSGMTPETIARIFDPFFTTKFTGRGLGLAAVLGIIRGHKGAIKVDSEPGSGTTFRLLLPAAKGLAQPIAPPAPSPSAWKGSGRVLVIDDEEAVREVSLSILRALGFEAEAAHDGIEGLEKFEAAPGRYTAVLLDLTMPRIDGEETFLRLRQLQPDVKVILMSGYNRVDAINRFTGKGLAGFVQKPFPVETLAAELQRVFTAGADH